MLPRPPSSTPPYTLVPDPTLFRALGLIDQFDSLLLLPRDARQEQSSTPKRLASLEAIAALVRATGNVIQPYHDQPRLFSQLFSIIRVCRSSPPQKIGRAHV